MKIIKLRVLTVEGIHTLDILEPILQIVKVKHLRVNLQGAQLTEEILNLHLLVVMRNNITNYILDITEYIIV